MDVKEHVTPSGQHYSGRNRVPNIREYAEQLDLEKRQRDAEINANAPRSSEASDHQSDNSTKKRHMHTVRDPVTGKDVSISDAHADYKKAVENPQLSVPNENLGKPSTVTVSSQQSGEEYRRAQDVTAPPDPVQEGSTSDVPISSEKTSILFYRTPSVSYEPMFEALERKATVLCLGIFISIVFIGKIFGGRLLGLIPLAACVSSGVFLWAKDLVRQGRDVEWSSEQERGETATANLIPESVEWMNTAIGIVWSLINPEMFASVADTLEDVMVASVPGVIENVRVADISQGSNPIRILSMRALPDSHVQDIKQEIHRENEKTMDPNELAAVEQAGSFYNMEVSVAYHAKPSSEDITSKAKNMGMQLVFYLGVKGLFGVPLPVWVELKGLVATARVRLQLTPDPPFLKTLTFTLMGVPKVQAGCTPMIERGVNILNLPLISNFVNWAIRTAASIYVAPKSLTMDVSKMLVGDDIKKETLALGLIFIRIHKATGLSKQDRTGSRGGGSDPYITVSWSKFSKPQFCTRVIQDDLNPVFEETCGLLVTSDLIKADEKLSMELWDSDRSTADDVVGKVELSIQKLIQHPGKMFPQVSNLCGVKADSSMPGHLHWEVGFFGKTQFRKALRTDGRDVSLPKELSDKPELQDQKGSIDSKEEDAVVHTPPDPLWPSGILSIVVHQIVGLELANIKGSDGKRKGKEYEPARPEAGEVKEEQSSKLPSSYCTVLVNDSLVYKTRIKAVSSQPIFNAGTERFVRDWRSCIATIAVRDSRNRQHDPIIGVVPLQLSDVLRTSSQVTRWYPLDGGIGFGRIRISLLFRSVELRLPPPQLGWDIGTFEFLSDSITITGYAPSETVKLKLRTGGSSATIKKDKSTRDETGIRIDISGGDNDGKMLRLPVRYRYRCPIFLEFYFLSSRKPDAYAALWLLELSDSEDEDFNVPIFTCNNGLRLSQNYITQENYQEIPDLDIKEVGRVRFRGRFSAGTDSDHMKFVRDNDSRETIETWEACYAEGVRQEEVNSEVPPLVMELHDKSLTHGRDVLAQAEESDKQRWLAKDGTDWSGAFGKDPSDLMASKSEGGRGSDAQDDDYDSSSSSDDNPDLGIEENESAEPGRRHSTESRDSLSSSTKSSPDGGGSSKNPYTMYKNYTARNRDLHRKHRGLMQWRPIRNAQFAKDEAKFALRKVKNLGGLGGRQPDVETEV